MVLKTRVQPMNVRLGVDAVSVHVSELSPPSTASTRSHRISVTRYDTTYRTLARWYQSSIRRASRCRDGTITSGRRRRAARALRALARAATIGCHEIPVAHAGPHGPARRRSRPRCRRGRGPEAWRDAGHARAARAADARLLHQHVGADRAGLEQGLRRAPRVRLQPEADP